MQRQSAAGRHGLVGTRWGRAFGADPFLVLLFAFHKVRARRIRDHREDTMGFCDTIGAAALAAALLMVGGAAAADDTKYPDLTGQWRRASNAGLLSGGAGGLRYDDSKPPKPTSSLGQEPPLTP